MAVDVGGADMEDPWNVVVEDAFGRAAIASRVNGQNSTFERREGSDDYTVKAVSVAVGAGALATDIVDRDVSPRGHPGGGATGLAEDLCVWDLRAGGDGCDMGAMPFFIDGVFFAFVGKSLGADELVSAGEAGGEVATASPLEGRRRQAGVGEGEVVGSDAAVEDADDNAFALAGFLPEAVVLVEAEQGGGVSGTKVEGFVNVSEEEAGDGLHEPDFVGCEAGGEARHSDGVGVDHAGFAGVEGGIREKRKVPSFAIVVGE
ncbi:hypothetical protein IEQ34_010327 [Dendrobium chrysotoxum]|uniref:Uncharacterized protein n=1 Tax=Dendrobium chrysotoxum TaxID=161865 RepID=A0AAV7H4G0_DENCH|nr:hypothetical protein IEQ34_010327 [Dendrobium chrysotoxum]